MFELKLDLEGNLELFSLPMWNCIVLYIFGSLRILVKQKPRYEDSRIGRRNCFTILFFVLHYDFICAYLFA